MSGSARTRSEQSCNARVLRTNESKCNRPEDSDVLSDTHSGRVSAARGARDKHSTLARQGLWGLKVTLSQPSRGVLAACEGLEPRAWCGSESSAGTTYSRLFRERPTAATAGWSFRAAR